MNSLLRMLAAVFLLAAASCSVKQADSGALQHELPERPNIILISAEDLSPRFGFMGDPVARTPHLDTLAEQSVIFTRTFTTAGVCAPARSALITGVQQTTLGTMHMRTGTFGKDMDHGDPYEAVPPAEIKAFPELLRRAGYKTFNRQKTDYQFGDPFTIWDDDDKSRDWPDTAGAEPFFVMINFPTTHEGKTWPPETDLGLHPAVKGATAYNTRMDAEKKLPLTDPADVRIPAYWPDTPVVRENLARTYDNVALMDSEVGRLLERLEAEGRFEDSIIIFTTDHGDGLPRHKRTIFDSGTHVPLLVRFPNGYQAGERRGELVSFVDLAPTILALAKVHLPDWIQGRDLFGAPAPDAIYAAGDRFDEVTQRFRGVREDRWHYIRYYSDAPVIPSLAYQNVNPIMREMRRLHAQGKLTPLQASYLDAPAPREFLFDTHADPDEVNNLADDPNHAGTKARLAGRLEQWIEDTADLGRLDESDVRERMWPAGSQPVTAKVEACRTSVNSVVLRSSTPGASIGWGGENGQRELFRIPLRLSEPFKTRAIRYGYKPSAIATIKPESLDRCA